MQSQYAVESPHAGRAPAFPSSHGARSPKVVRPLADRFATELLDVAPWAASPTFAGVVASWSWAEAQAHLLRAYLDENGLLQVDGKPQNAAVFLSSIESRLASLRTQLGLDPLSLARLLATLSTVQQEAAASGLDALRQTGAEIRQRAELRLVADDTAASSGGDAG